MSENIRLEHNSGKCQVNIAVSDERDNIKLIAEYLDRHFECLLPSTFQVSIANQDSAKEPFERMTINSVSTDQMRATFKELVEQFGGPKSPAGIIFDDSAYQTMMFTILLEQTGELDRLTFPSRSLILQEGVGSGLEIIVQGNLQETGRASDTVNFDHISIVANDQNWEVSGSVKMESAPAEKWQKAWDLFL